MLKIVMSLKYSRLFIVLLIILHLAAVVALLMANLSWWAEGFGFVAIVLSAYYHIWLVGFQKASWAIVKCERNENDWALHLKNGKEVVAQLKKDVFVSPWFLILRFKAIDKNWWRCRTLVVFKDAVDADVFRQTKVFLLQARDL